MNLQEEEITNVFQIQEVANKTEDIEVLKRLELIVARGQLGNPEQRMTLSCYLRGKIKSIQGK